MIEIEGFKQDKNPYEEAYYILINVLFREELKGLTFDEGYTYNEILRMLNLALIVTRLGGTIEDFIENWNIWKSNVELYEDSKKPRRMAKE